MLGTSRRRRRALLTLGAAAFFPASVAIAQGTRAPRVAFLSGSAKADTLTYFDSFVNGLRDLGYRAGENIVIEAYYADYSSDRARELAAAIAAAKPSVVVANGAAIEAAYAFARVVPLVLLHSGDPVEAGFADSFRRPGRNATGISLLALDLIPKRIQLMKEIKPGARRFALLCSPEHPGQRKELQAFRAAAEASGAEVTYHEARTPAELAAILPDVASARPDAALLFSDALMTGQRTRLAEFFLAERIPSAAGFAAFVEGGHILSYGPERHAAWRRLASFVDAILKGAPAGELPIELPQVVELAVNRRTATAMKLALPPTILARADRVID
jgi:putative ABC transport system substrate-binding protein